MVRQSDLLSTRVSSLKEKRSFCKLKLICALQLTHFVLFRLLSECSNVLVKGLDDETKMYAFVVLFFRPRVNQIFRVSFGIFLGRFKEECIASIFV